MRRLAYLSLDLPNIHRSDYVILTKHDNETALVTSVAQAILTQVNNDRPIRLYMSGGKLTCRIVSNLGQMAKSLGYPSLRSVRVQMIDEYDKLPPLHDQSRYYGLAKSVSEWPDCYYGDVIIPAACGDCVSESEARDVPQPRESKPCVVAVIDMGADGTYELLLQPLDESGKPRYMALPPVLIDKWSRMFERYANTPTRVFVLGWLSYLLAERMHILCAGNSAVESLLALLDKQHPSLQRSHDAHVTVHAHAEKNLLLRLSAALERQEPVP